MELQFKLSHAKYSSPTAPCAASQAAGTTTLTGNRGKFKGCESSFHSSTIAQQLSCSYARVCNRPSTWTSTSWITTLKENHKVTPLVIFLCAHPLPIYQTQEPQTSDAVLSEPHGTPGSESIAALMWALENVTHHIHKGETLCRGDEAAQQWHWVSITYTETADFLWNAVTGLFLLYLLYTSYLCA